MSFIYGSWNIQNLSENHIGKMAWVDVRVQWAIADIMLDNEVALMGAMEVTLTTGGEHACNQIKNSINARVKEKGLSASKYAVKVSERNVDESDTESRKADKYAVFFDTTKFSISHLKVIHGFSFRDRQPLYYKATTTGGRVIESHLWHAPNPSNMKKSSKKELESLNLAIAANTGPYHIMSGDFNMATTSPGFDQFKTLGFNSVLPGSPTMLSVENTFQTQANLLLSLGHKPAESVMKDLMMGKSYDNILVKGMTISKSVPLNIGWLYFSRKYKYELTPTTDRDDLIIKMSGSLTKARILSDHCPVFGLIN